MQKLFERMRERLTGFIRQRDNLALVVSCREAESAYILKTLQGIDEANATDLFWLFAEEFSEPGTYVRAVASRFQEKHQEVRRAHRDKGLTAWPELPSRALDESRPPLERLRRLMVFARSLLPSTEGHHLVWAMFPLRIANPGAWAEFVIALLRHDISAPWCHHMRIVLRDDPEHPALAKGRRIDWYAPDLTRQAMEGALEEDAADEALPLPQRLQALLIMATTDYSYGRYSEATEKYRLLLRYYLGTRNHTLAALVLNGLGEVEQKLGNPAGAQSYFESALTPAIEGKAYPVLLNITLNLANLKLGRREWAEAESYYDSAEKLATAHLIAETKIQCLDNRGYCQYMQGKTGAAVESWMAGITLASSLEERGLQKRMLERLRDHFGRAGDRDQRRAIEAELARIG